MHNYLIRFHKGTPSESTCILELNCKATSDIPACMYRDVLEKELKEKLDFDFTICQREGFMPEDIIIRDAEYHDRGPMGLTPSHRNKD